MNSLNISNPIDYKPAIGEVNVYYSGKAYIDGPHHYKVALYIRLSKEDIKPGESESITNQRSMLTRFAKDQRLTIIDEYVDDGISRYNI